MISSSFKIKKSLKNKLKTNIRLKNNPQKHKSNQKYNRVQMINNMKSLKRKRLKWRKMTKTINWSQNKKNKIKKKRGHNHRNSKLSMKSQNLNQFKSAQSSWPYANFSKLILSKIINQRWPNFVLSTRLTPLCPVQKLSKSKSQWSNRRIVSSNKTWRRL